MTDQPEITSIERLRLRAQCLQAAASLQAGLKVARATQNASSRSGIYASRDGDPVTQTLQMAEEFERWLLSFAQEG